MHRKVTEHQRNAQHLSLTLACEHKVMLPAGNSLPDSVCCELCDKLEFPTSLQPYKQTPIFTQDTVPAGLLRNHTTKTGTWGVINVVSGQLSYVIESQAKTLFLKPGVKGIIPPGLPHHVTPDGPVTFFVEFWRKEANSGHP